MSGNRNFYADGRTYACIKCGTIKPMRFNGKNLYCSRACTPQASKGRIFSEETKQLMAISAKGKHKSPDTEIKPGQRLSPKTEYGSRSNNKNWKGGTSFKRQSFGNSKYMVWRTAVLERDNYICQYCGKQSEFNETDHIKPWAVNEPLRFDISNGQTLCKPCHRLKSNHDLSVMFSGKISGKKFDK